MGFMITALVLLALLSQGPQLWASWILRRHNTPLATLPGGGGDFAAWLLKRQNLPHVTIEPTEAGDHYDPMTRCVRLSPAHFSTPSLTAMAVAAHEVAHAAQHAEQDPAFMERLQLLERARWLERFSIGALLAIPILIPLTHTPIAGLIAFAAGFIARGVPLIIHLRTLSVEWDASFRRALPWLRDSGHFSPQQLRVMERILLACALTYAATALSSLFNLWRWLSPRR